MLVGEVDTQRELAEAVREGVIEWSQAMHGLTGERGGRGDRRQPVFLRRLTGVLNERGRFTALIIALVGMGFWGGLLLFLQLATAVARLAVRINAAGLRSLVWGSVTWWVAARLILTFGATGVLVGAAAARRRGTGAAAARGRGAVGVRVRDTAGGCMSPCRMRRPRRGCGG